MIIAHLLCILSELLFYCLCDPHILCIALIVLYVCCITFVVIKQPKLTIRLIQIGAWTLVLRTGYCTSQYLSPSYFESLRFGFCCWQFAMSGVQGLDVAKARHWRGMVKAFITLRTCNVPSSCGRFAGRRAWLREQADSIGWSWRQGHWPVWSSSVPNHTRRARGKVMTTGSLTCLII